jgi:thiol-disulfide isomerase/thioredoxin
MDGGREALDKRKHKTVKNHHRQHHDNNHKKRTVLLLHADWCGHCQHLMPEWDKMEKEIKTPGHPLYGKCNIVKIESSNIDNELPKYKKMTHQKDIPVAGYPTIAMISGGNLNLYGGERNSSAIANWIGKGGDPQIGGKRRKPKKLRTRKSKCSSCKSGSLFKLW